MKLYLIRHAKAEPLSERYPEDSIRPLARDGRRELVSMMRVWKRLDVHFDTIITSPYSRALQTAKLIRKKSFSYNKVLLSDVLKPDPDFEAIRHLLNDFNSSTSVALVGHNPYLEEFAATLLNLTEPLIEFKTSGLAGFDLPVGTGKAHLITLLNKP